MIQAVLFDLDGTLIDTSQDFVLVVNTLRREENLSPLDAHLIRQTVSHGARALVALAFDLPEGDDKFESLRLRLLALYAQHLATSSQPFSGIRELIIQLSNDGIKWGIVTNKPSNFSNPLVEAMCFEPPTQTLICPDQVSQSKPHPEPLFKACEEIACEPEHCIYIGDHQRDIEAGRRAGMRTIAAAYGYLHQDDDPQDWQADYIVQQPSDIYPLLSSLTQ